MRRSSIIDWHLHLSSKRIVVPQLVLRTKFPHADSGDISHGIWCDAGVENPRNSRNLILDGQCATFHDLLILGSLLEGDSYSDATSAVNVAHSWNTD